MSDNTFNMKHNIGARLTILMAGISGLTLLGVAGLSSPRQAASTQNGEASAFFETKVRPVLAENCFVCHGDRQQKSGLRLDSKENLAKGGKNGTVITAGNPDGSRLIIAIRYDAALKMPPAGKLKPSEIEALTTWVKSGAIWPAAPAVIKPKLDAGHFKAGSEKFWSFQPVKVTPSPSVKTKSWCKSDLDDYILAGLEAKGLHPAEQADKRTLIRRATFDLTGLPPTPAEIDSFLKDNSPDAFSKVVDHLLASPRYGERWGRHWLDVVRYADSADSRGLGSEGDISEAWRYRDWVVDAFNQDMPYNQFIVNQIAGDLLPAGWNRLIRVATREEGRVRREEGRGKREEADINIPGTIATGLLAIGNWGNGDADKEKILTDIADDQLDIVSRGFMGLTVACARCHDHKFDPITTKDYYGIAGIFMSTHILPKLTPKGAGETPMRIPLLSKSDRENRDHTIARIASLEKDLKAEKDAKYHVFAESQHNQTALYVEAAWEYQNRPSADANLSMGKFAEKQGLKEYALRQWSEYLGMGGDYKLITEQVRDVLNNPGVFAWRGKADCPNLTVNTTDKSLMLLTFTLPPKSVCVHPGPTNGIAIEWVSPISGTVGITGGVKDADPACGNGIAWVIDRSTRGGRRDLASGEFPNGGAQEFSQAKTASNLKNVVVQAGEKLELLVLPNGEYSCDTTVVDFLIKEKDVGKVWNITKELMTDPLRSNPRSDSYGTSGVWRFTDMADSPRGAKPVSPVSPALIKWQQSIAAIPDGVLVTAEGDSIIKEAAREFQNSFQASDSSSPFYINSRDDEKYLSPDDRTQLAKIEVELDTLRKRPLPPILFANGAQDGGVPESSQQGTHDIHVHIRGRYDRLGDLVPRHFPVVLAGLKQPEITQGSGRLELARWIASDNHPLTSRVIVNRIWQHHFGQGIVRTPSNFGFLGERPTNPALLDYLANQFVKSGWSIKKMHRMIMLSATYQQSSISPAKSLKADADNRLFGRMNRQRLEAEAVRDNLLSVTGKLDTTMGGVAYRDFNMPRRTLYYMTVRSDRTGFGPLFDVADSTASVDRRTVSTVAPQALFMLNNPFVLEQTRALAGRILTSKTDESAHITQAYELLYGRLPFPEELKIGRGFLNQTRKSSSAFNTPPDKDHVVWEAYCHILLSANEFCYID